MRQAAFALPVLLAACAQQGYQDTPYAALDDAFSIGDAGQSISASETTVDGYPGVQLTITEAEQKGDIA